MEKCLLCEFEKVVTIESLYYMSPVALSSTIPEVPASSSERRFDEKLYNEADFSAFLAAVGGQDLNSSIPAEREDLIKIQERYRKRQEVKKLVKKAVDAETSRFLNSFTADELKDVNAYFDATAETDPATIDTYHEKATDYLQSREEIPRLRVEIKRQETLMKGKRFETVPDLQARIDLLQIVINRAGKLWKKKAKKAVQDLESDFDVTGLVAGGSKTEATGLLRSAKTLKEAREKLVQLETKFSTARDVVILGAGVVDLYSEAGAVKLNTEIASLLGKAVPLEKQQSVLSRLISMNEEGWIDIKDKLPSAVQNRIDEIKSEIETKVKNAITSGIEHTLITKGTRIDDLMPVIKDLLTKKDIGLKRGKDALQHISDILTSIKSGADAAHRGVLSQMIAKVEEAKNKIT